MRAYLGTNLFIEMLYFPESSSAKIISGCGSGIFTPVISEYGITEILENVKRNLGKEIASSLRELILSIPGLVTVEEWRN
jgi:hypothetical protein